MAGPPHDVDNSNRDRREYDEFRESVATPVPNRTYRSEVDHTLDRPTVAERVVRIVALILGALLAIRFVINLFAAYHVGGFTGFINGATAWAVAPFQALFGQPPATSGGYFDWPALAAIIVIGIISSIVLAMIRRRS